MRKKLYILVLCMISCFQLSAQQDAKAEEILYKMRYAYEHSDGVKITFNGSAEGTLLLQGTKFFLDSNGVQSWFNGTTQWSYVPSNEEVTISNPTPEEILSINPYSILLNYKKGYHYEYLGSKRFNQEEVYEVKLTPKEQTDVKYLTFCVNKSYQPSFILVLLADQSETSFQVQSYKEKMNYQSDAFEFPQKQYPNAEIIDLR